MLLKGHVFMFTTEYNYLLYYYFNKYCMYNTNSRVEWNSILLLIPASLNLKLWYNFSLFSEKCCSFLSSPYCHIKSSVGILNCFSNLFVTPITFKCPFLAFLIYYFTLDRCNVWPPCVYRYRPQTIISVDP